MRPAARLGVEFEDGVATAIVAEISAQPAGLPLLQFSLAELYERRVKDLITSAALEELGGIGGAVGRRAETIYDDLSPDLRTHARELFGRLVAPGQGTQDVRRRARLGELSEPAREVADRFVAARLLVADHDVATREPVVEVAHEALLSSWPRLREWLESDRAWLAQLHHLATVSRAWHEAGCSDGELYRGARLEAVIEVLPHHGHELSDDEQAFVEASREARDAVRVRERRTNRRLRTLLVATACMLAVALIAGVIAFTQRQHADSSRRGAQLSSLANRSAALRSSQRDVAALLAIEAQRLQPGVESTSALFGTFDREPGFLGYKTFGSGESADIEGSIVPTSASAVIAIIPTTLGADNPPLRRVDVLTGELGPPFDPVGPHDHGTLDVAVSGDGKVAVEFTLQMVDRKFVQPQMAAFDVSTGRMIGHPVPTPVTGNTNYPLAVNRNGTQMAIASGTDGVARIYDVATGALLASIPPPPDMEPSVSGRDTSVVGWAPDGTVFVGSSGAHLRSFDPSTFQLERDWPVPRFATGGLLKFSDDGTFVVTRGVVEHDGGAQSGAVARIELPSGRVTWTIGPDEYGFGQCDSVAYSVPQDRMWCGDYFGVIRGRSLSTGALDGTTIEHQRGWLSGLDVVDANGRPVLVSLGRNVASIGRWVVDGTGPIIHRIDASDDFAQYSPDGRWILMSRPAGSDGFAVSIWDANNHRQLLTLPDNVDAQWVDAGHLGALIDDGHLRVVDVATGTSHVVPIHVDRNYSTVNIVANGRLAFGYDDGHVDVFNTDTGAETVRLQVVNPKGTFQPPVRQIAGSADGTRIYVTSVGLFEFDASDGHEIRHTANTQYWSIAVNGNGPIVVGSLDGEIGLLDPKDLHLQATLPGARGWAPTLRYSADGRLLLARANDNTVSLYDVQSRRRIGDSIASGNADADLRPDGRELLVAGGDGIGVLTWSLDPSALSQAACDVAGRNLTRPEWDTYIGHLDSYHQICPQFGEATA